MNNNISHKMKKINSILDIHLKTKAILIKKIDRLLKAIGTDEAKSKLHKQEIDKIIDKAKEILNYLNK